MSAGVEFKQENPHSMTGYGRATISSEHFRFTVDLKSLNSKFLELRLKIPRFLSFWEPQLKSQISQYIKRGGLELYLNYQVLDSNLYNPINEKLVESLATSAETLAQKINIEGDITVANLLRLPGTFVVEEFSNITDDLKEKMNDQLNQTLHTALYELLVMRAKEGKSIIIFLQRELSTIKKNVSEIRKISVEVNEKLKTKIKERIEKNLKEISTELDESRLMHEVAYYLDKSDITEEIDRLSSHITQFREIIEKTNGDFLIGKRLDFIIQEMLRETNTIGSKTNNINLTNIVVNLKVSLDRIREQVQNIE